jgi:hypothetical protein
MAAKALVVRRGRSARKALVNCMIAENLWKVELVLNHEESLLAIYHCGPDNDGA